MSVSGRRHMNIPLRPRRAHRVFAAAASSGAFVSVPGGQGARCAMSAPCGGASASGGGIPAPAESYSDAPAELNSGMDTKVRYNMYNLDELTHAALMVNVERHGGLVGTERTNAMYALANPTGKGQIRSIDLVFAISM